MPALRAFLGIPVTVEHGVDYHAQFTASRISTEVTTFDLHKVMGKNMNGNHSPLHVISGVAPVLSDLV